MRRVVVVVVVLMLMYSCMMVVAVMTTRQFRMTNLYSAWPRVRGLASSLGLPAKTFQELQAFKGKKPYEIYRN
jgi:hypothetical protein